MLSIVQKSVSDEYLFDKGQIQTQYRIFIKLCELLKKSEYLISLELIMKNDENLTNEDIKNLQEMLEESSKSVDIISSFSMFYEKDENFEVLEKNAEFFQTFLNKDLESLQNLFITRLNELESE